MTLKYKQLSKGQTGDVAIDARNRIVNFSLIATMAIGFVALLGSLYRIIVVGWQFIFAFHSAAWLIVALLVIFRYKLSYSVRAWSLIGIYFSIGMVGVAAIGLIGNSISLFLTSMILATLLFGKRVGILLSILSAIYIAFIGICITSGLIVHDFDVAAYSIAIPSWLLAFITVFFLFGMLLTGLTWLQSALNQSIEELNLHKERLEETVIERTQLLEEEVEAGKLLSKQLSNFHERLTVELAVASKMQTEEIPSLEQINEIEKIYGVKIASQFKPSSELGGDYWALQAIDQFRFGVLLVDFSGHGISAALNTFRLNMVLSRLGVCNTSPAEYMELINSELSEVLAVGQFCTMIYTIIDIENNSLVYSGAAAPSPIIGDVDKGSVDTLDASGLPIGIIRNAKYHNNVVDFPEGSFYFMFSDALFETELGSDGHLNIEGVVALAEKYRSKNATQSLNGVLSSFMENAPDPVPDDLTSIWISY